VPYSLQCCLTTTLSNSPAQFRSDSLRPSTAPGAGVEAERRLFLRSGLSACTASLFSVSALSLTACKPATPDTPSFTSVDITGADFARDFKLRDHNGQPRTIKDFRGKVVVMFFGFLNCPDVCPTTLAEWNGIRDRLPKADQDKLQILFVTVDPERDTAEKIKPYVTNFHVSNLGLVGSAQEIETTAKAYKVIYQKVETKGPDGKVKENYNMDHTAASFVYDVNGNIRLYVRMNQKPEDTAKDVAQVLAKPLPAKG
jgi:protein SCO1